MEVPRNQERARSSPNDQIPDGDSNRTVAEELSLRWATATTTRATRSQSQKQSGMARYRLRPIPRSLALEPLWLQAQAVPSASLVPCVRFLPVGWSVAQVTVNDGRSVITLDHDRAGAAALVVRLTAACVPAEAVEGPSAMAGVRHYQGIKSTTGEFTATWYDQFPGGCVTSRLHLTVDPNGEFAAQAPQVLGFTTRAALQEALSQRSDGRLQLDPGGAR